MPPFVRCLGIPIAKEFKRFAKQNEWDKLKNSKDKKLRAKYWAERRRFIGNAVVEDFTGLYGKDAMDSKSWEKLFQDLGGEDSVQNTEEHRTVSALVIPISHHCLEILS